MKSQVKEASPEIQGLYRRALEVRAKAYAPYSGFQVGAAVLTQDGHIYTGCNVENASYGGTNCAERVAIQKGVSEQGQIEIKAVMVVTQAESPWPPCGMCRQVIAEFGKTAILYVANVAGDLLTFSFDEVFPFAFTPSHLKA